MNKLVYVPFFTFCVFIGLPNFAECENVASNYLSICDYINNRSNDFRELECLNSDDGDHIWVFMPEGGDNSPIPITVPGWWEPQLKDIIDDVQAGWYRLNFFLPESMEGKNIKLCFDAVSFKARVSLNGLVILGEHTGMFEPFEFDISGHVRPHDEMNTLLVKVENIWTAGRSEGMFTHPYGFPFFEDEYDDNNRSGIYQSVYLKAHNPIYIKDVFINTNVVNGVSDSADLSIVVRNEGSAAVLGMRIENHAILNGSPAFTFDTRTFVAAPGDTTIEINNQWENAQLWWPLAMMSEPVDPALYTLESKLYIPNDTQVDQLETKFGFREVEVVNGFLGTGVPPHFKLNGVRMNLRGAADGPNFIQIVNNANYFENRYNDDFGPLNIDYARMRCPVPCNLDVADRIGFLVLAASGIHNKPDPAMQYNWGDANEDTLENMRTHVRELVHLHRNHPSIIMWSAENEVYSSSNILCEPPNPVDAEQLYTIGEEMSQSDPSSRPVNYDNDCTMNGYSSVANVHYPFSREELESDLPDGNRGPYHFPTDSFIYWAKGPYYTIPVGVGEFLWDSLRINTPELNVAMSQQRSLQTRGFRYADISDIRPFQITKTVINIDPNTGEWEYPELRDLMRKSLSPIGVFDSQFDASASILSFDNVAQVTKRIVRYGKGTNLHRRLIIYNDELAGTDLDIFWSVDSINGVVARATEPVHVDLGYHEEIGIDFTLPNTISANGEYVDLTLEAYKSSTLKYHDLLTFEVVDTPVEIICGPDVIYPQVISNEEAYEPPAQRSNAITLAVVEDAGLLDTLPLATYFKPYDEPGINFHLACGDVDGDGEYEVITSAEEPGSPLIKIFERDGRFSESEYYAYPLLGYRGAFVAAGDIDGDGIDEIITGPDKWPSAEPYVRAFDADGTPFKNGTDNDEVNFLVLDQNFRGGVRVACGDVNSDGCDEIIVGAGPADNFDPSVEVYQFTPNISEPNRISYFNAYDTSFNGGVYVSCGDVDGDDIDEIVTGAGDSGGFGGIIIGPEVRSYEVDGTLLASLYAYPQTFNGGVRVACGDVDSLVGEEILVAPGSAGIGPQDGYPVCAFEYDGSTPIFSSKFSGYGISVTAWNIP